MKFRDNKFELDYYLNHREEDLRRGVTLIGRLGNEVTENIIDFIEECKAIEPGQHYYERNEIHITILSIISCYNGFHKENIDKEQYVDIIKKSIDKAGPIEIRFRGITASPSCIMIQGYPVDDRLKKIRDQLRENFSGSKLENSIDKRYLLETAHSTIIRFKNQVKNPDPLLECLYKYRTQDFGITQISHLDFVFNDWYMSNKVVSNMKTFIL
jgi:2'-5' RNA ligase